MQSQKSLLQPSNFTMSLRHDQNAEVLIVDDTPANLELLVGALKKCGHVVRVAANGEMALRAVKFRVPELILMDISMPDMDGYAVCQRLKTAPAWKHIPVVFISALTEINQKMKAFGSGGVDYITKPFSIQEVQVRVALHLRLSRQQRELAEHGRRLQQTVREQLEQLSTSQSSTIFALAKLAEARDKKNGEHLERVRKTCKLLAEALQEDSTHQDLSSANFAANIYQTSSLHDIGKTGIPEAILLKPGPLTEAEFEVVKTHTLIGAQTLEEVHELYPSDLLEMAMAIARSHHEKWDGSGYPDGLAGESIPLCARIMGLTDAYDAIRSKRCYKETLPHETACEIIARDSGKHFDPQLVALFLKLESEFRQIYQ